MIRFAKLLAVIFAVGCSGSEPGEFHLPDDMSKERILFVGAHPDDEWGVAPILAEACKDKGAKCHFVVASEARSFGCLFTIDLTDPVACSEMRRQEMKSSAALFGAEAEFFGWDDLFYSFNETGLVRTIDDWAASNGGREALVRRFASAITAYRPTMIFTLDPRHGSTCHASHRAVATLLIEAVERAPENQRPPVWLEQTDEIEERSDEVARIIKSLGYAAWPDTRSETIWFDATKPMGNGRTPYDYALEVRRTHKSQMPDEASGKIVSTATPEERRVPLARYRANATGDFCSMLKLERPTMDIPGLWEEMGLR